MSGYAYLTLLFIFAKVTSASYTIETYTTVMNSLLSNYSNKVRPIKDQGESLDLYMAFYLLSINEVSTTEQKMSTTGYLLTYWWDELLVWNYTTTKIEWMTMKQKDIWIPDIVVKNGLTEFKSMGGDFYYTYVHYTGQVYWYPYAVFETLCELDVTYFPFDTQQCSIQITTWTYPRTEVNLTFPDEKVGFFNFVPNSIWDLVSYDAYTDYSINYDQYVSYNLKLKRKSQFFVLNLILPIVFVGILALVVFIIPADAGEKMGYSVTIFLAFAVFLSIVSAELPTNSDTTSILSIYLIIELIISTLSLLISSVQLRLNFRKPNRKIGEGFRKIVRLGRKLRCEKSKRNDGKTLCFSIPCTKSVQTHKINVADCESKMTRNKTDDTEEEEEIEWSDVSSAIDFFSFWILFSMQVIVTITVFSYATLG